MSPEKAIELIFKLEAPEMDRKELADLTRLMVNDLKSRMMYKKHRFSVKIPCQKMQDQANSHL
jgi:hypothetical protein